MGLFKWTSRGQGKIMFATDTLLQKASIKIDQGQLNTAESILRDILRSHPDHAAANYKLAQIAIAVNKHEQALPLLERAFLSKPEDNNYLNALLETLKIITSINALANSSSGKLQLKIREYTSLLPVAPEHRGYQLYILKLKRSKYMEFPAHIHIETFAKCNAACTFCPYPTMDRIGEKMSDTLIEKIITDLEDIPREHKFHISPFKVNEPFLDNRIFEILNKLQNRLPNALITLTTNATPLTIKKIEKLSCFQGIGYLWISFNDHRQEEYEKTMKLPFSRTIERLDMIHGEKAKGRFDHRVVLSRVGDGTRADIEFSKWVKKNYPLFESSIFPKGQWLGQITSDGNFVNPPNIGCQRWFDISITSTGVVAHCCMDGKAEFPIGDVNKTHILEIYNSKEYRNLRENVVSRLTVAPCNTCSFH